MFMWNLKLNHWVCVGRSITVMSNSDLPGDFKLFSPNSGRTMLSGIQEESLENGDDDFEDELTDETERYMRARRRAISLPAYPEQAALFEEISGRKRVKFADSMGLNLASVKHFMPAEYPRIPPKVMLRLRVPPELQDRERQIGDLCVNFTSTLTMMDRLIPTFQMPVESSGFETEVLHRRVTLETVTVTHFDVRGQIRTNNPTCSTCVVGVRYTFNDWLSYVDAQAVPAPEEEHLVGERYTFVMFTPPFLGKESSVHFAVFVKSDQGEFWDNNHGRNYTLKYHGTGVPT
ncbi:hypothetical protein DPEC_G00072930 [Dallia pectoralis]|uniref:Uncharacterized protein n=1 Tax=Dallia pectoralis TaxID=75939 RepID=A0ACC2H3W2_DALPE|nr:hypothetical protein DPEC_G00072930 [Dallia pectoralis]